MNIYNAKKECSRVDACNDENIPFCIGSLHKLLLDQSQLLCSQHMTIPIRV